MVGVRAGSAQYPGAALLSVAGAACGLAGMVRYVGDEAVADRSETHHPEVVGEGRVQAWVVGSGGGDAAGQELHAALADGVPVVVDADALQHLEAGRAAVLTPHAGELAAMLGEERQDIESRPLHFAREAARKYDATVLLKGRRTVIARPDGKARVNTTGTAVARHRRGRRRARRRDRGTAGRRPHGVRRGLRRRLAARRGGGAASDGGPLVASEVAARRCPRGSVRGSLRMSTPAPRSWSTWPRSVTTCAPSASSPARR